jgi:hypothetical protein
MFSDSAEAAIRPNVANFVCLSPKEDPESQAAFWPLFEARNKAIDAGDKAEEDRLSEAMRPYQYVSWERSDFNQVTNVGRNDLLDKYWRGSTYTQTVVMGLAGTGTKAAADTQASHAGWLEVGGTNAPVYTGNRKAVTMGAASSQASVSPQQTFAITSSGTVAGLFMNNGGSSTKDDTTGVLVSAVNFTGGNQVVNNGDSLLVTYTFNG